MMRKTTFCFSAWVAVICNLFFFSAVKINAQVLANDSLTAGQLVQKLVGTGVSYSNPVLICDSIASGTFKTVSSNLGLDSGIILTTGRVLDGTYFGFPQSGMNADASILASTDLGLISVSNQDAQLDSILAPAGTSSYDACILEFDFVPTGDSLNFRYVFGSEEYTNYSCTAFNDIFAFFLTGPGYLSATNIALLPGTNIPVAVNSTTDTIVNNSGGPDCTNMGPGSPFAQYYVNNLNGATIVYNGFTKVFTAKAAVQACSTYHIKLAIADAGDGALDSGVFLEAGSFTSNATAINLSFVSTYPANSSGLLEGCYNGTVTVKRYGQVTNAQTVHLSYSGNAVRNTDYTGAPDSIIIPANDSVATFVITATGDNVTEGIETISIKADGTTGCNAVTTTDSIGIRISEPPAVVLLSNDTSTCEGEITVALHVKGDSNMQVSWTSNPTSTIQNATDTLTFATPTETTTYTAQVSNGACSVGTASFTVTIDKAPQVNIIPFDTTVCLRDSMKIRAEVQPANAYTYSWAPAANLSSADVIEPYFFSDQLADHFYILTVTSPAGCVGSDSVTIHSRPPVQLTNVTADATIKYGDEIQLNANGALHYTWVPGAGLTSANISNPIAQVWNAVTYIVYGENEYGCKDSASVKIDVDYTMNLSIPSVFSPNGDGLNDVFRILGVTYQQLLSFIVVNRWGQVVFHTTNFSEGWDGTFMGVPQELGTYQYLIRVKAPAADPADELKMYKGDITLVR